MIYRIVCNGEIFRIQIRLWFFPVWFFPWWGRLAPSFKSRPDAEEAITDSIVDRKKAGEGPWMVHAWYDPYTGSDWHDSPTNVEQLMRARREKEKLARGKQ